MKKFDLQINLSPGDIDYANKTVPYIVKKHKENVKDVILVVDCCRPQKTKIVDPESSFPKNKFNKKVERIRSISDNLKKEGDVDVIYDISPDSEILNCISRKYLRGVVNETHAFGGTALMSYLVGLEIPEHRYVVHYDGDMLLYQREGYDWAVQALKYMKDEPKAVAATPRVSPPFEDATDMGDAPSRNPGRPFAPVQGGWRNDWFSTRCFLIDTDKLKDYLPLLEGRLLLKAVAGKLLRRAYPMKPETMFSEKIGGQGGWRLNLKSKKAWLLHPDDKGQRFIELLPNIQEALSKGRLPDSQRGHPNVDLEAWMKYFESVRT